MNLENKYYLRIPKNQIEILSNCMIAYIYILSVVALKYINIEAVSTRFNEL